MWMSSLAGWPLSELGIAFGLVLLGASLQVATGVGLGLIAGPSLLFFVDGPAAIQTAIVLNLALTVCLLPGEMKDVAGGPLGRLCLWACVGIPIGCALLLMSNSTTLRIISGVVVLLAVAQLRLFPPPGKQAGAARFWVMRVGGTVSGGMTGALAVPGPIALWTLLSTGLDTAVLRATLRAYFLVAYALALVLHLLLAQRSAQSWELGLFLLPAVGLGIVAGLFSRRLVKPEYLRAVLELVLLVMGLSLLIRGIWHG